MIVYKQVCLGACVSMNKHVCVCTSRCACVSMSKHVCVCEQACVSVNMCVCVCVCFGDKDCGRGSSLRLGVGGAGLSCLPLMTSLDTRNPRSEVLHPVCPLGPEDGCCPHFCHSASLCSISSPSVAPVLPRPPESCSPAQAPLPKAPS